MRVQCVCIPPRQVAKVKVSTYGGNPDLNRVESRGQCERNAVGEQRGTETHPVKIGQQGRKARVDDAVPVQPLQEAVAHVPEDDLSSRTKQRPGCVRLGHLQIT